MVLKYFNMYYIVMITNRNENVCNKKNQKNKNTVLLLTKKKQTKRKLNTSPIFS